MLLLGPYKRWSTDVEKMYINDWHKNKAKVKVNKQIGKSTDRLTNEQKVYSDKPVTHIGR